MGTIQMIHEMEIQSMILALISNEKNDTSYFHCTSLPFRLKSELFQNDKINTFLFKKRLHKSFFFDHDYKKYLDPAHF